MKLIVPFLFVVFISLSGCKTTTGPNNNDSGVAVADTTNLPLVKAEFRVNGMHCTGCENTIKSNIREIKGVKTVDASFQDSSTIVSFDSSQTNEIAILSAIEDAGYKVDTFMRK